MKILALTLLAVAGCSQTPQKGTGALLGPLPAAGVVPTQDQSVSSVTVSEAVPAGAKILGEVAGTSCRNSAIDPPPTEAIALEQARQKAANLGANGIAVVTYEKEGLNLVKNCWSTITAKATAYLAQPS